MRANLSRSYPPTPGRPPMLARQRQRCRRCGKHVWWLAPDGCCQRCTDYRQLGRWQPARQPGQLAHGQALDAAGHLPASTNQTARQLHEAANTGVPVLPPVLAGPRRRWGWGR